MNNLDRRAKLEKALAPSLPNDTIRFADMAWGIQCHANRLAPLHAVLLEAVEALKCNETFHRLGGIDDCEPCKALAKIDKALEGVGGE